MRAIRNALLSAIGIASVLLLVSPMQRRAIARKLAEARRAVSRRLIDDEARASSRAEDAWEGEGGATRGESNADGANRASSVIASQR